MRISELIRELESPDADLLVQSAGRLARYRQIIPLLRALQLSEDAEVQVDGHAIPSWVALLPRFVVIGVKEGMRTTAWNLTAKSADPTAFDVFAPEAELLDEQDVAAVHI